MCWKACCRHRTPAGGAVLAACRWVAVLLLAPVAAAAEGTALVPERPVDGEIAPGEAHGYSFAAAAEQYLRLRLDQQGIDLGLTLYAPGGGPPQTVDGSGGRWVEELLSLVTETAGSYRLEVTARPGGGNPGRYRLALEELRDASPVDRTRLRGESSYHRGRHLRQLPSREKRLEALDAFRAAAAAFRQAEDAKGEADAVDQMGGVHLRLGEPRTAGEHFQQALDLYRGSGHLAGEADAENDLGIAHQRLGAAEQALGHYLRALELWRRLGDERGEAMTRNALGWFYRSRGEHPAALDSYQQALVLRRAAGDRPGEALTLSNLGVVYRKLGELAKGLDCYRRALAIARQTGDRDREALLLYNLAAVHRGQGELEPALDGYRRALETSRALGNRRLEQRILTALADTYRALGEPEAAREQLLGALDLARESESRVEEAWILMTLGWVYDTLDRAVEARAHFTQALAVSRETATRGAELQSLRGLARCYRREGRLADALAALEQALAISRERGDTVVEVDILREVGKARLAAGEPLAARNPLRQALELNRGLDDPIRGAMTRGDLARAERALGRLAAARAEVEQALQGYAEVRTAVVSPELRASFRAGRYRDYELHVDLLMELDRRQPGSGLAAAALAASEGARARGLVELLAEAGIEVRSGIAPELVQREAEIARRLTGIQSRLLRELSGGERDQNLVAALRQRLAAARDQRSQLEGEIRRRHPRYADVHYPRPLELDEIQSFLADDTALFEYALGEERSFLFVVTRGSFAAHELAPAAEIAELVEQFRAAARQPGRRLQGRLNLVSRRLHELLAAPAAGSLKGIDKLLIVPDRELYYLPFEALLAPSGEALRWAVAYVPSATVLSSLSRSAGLPTPAGEGGKRFVGFAQPLDPAGGWSSTETPAFVTRGAPGLFQRSWPPLPGSVDEVRAIARLYPENEAVVYVGADAGEEKLKGNPVVARAQVLHFAAHGFVDDREPAYSSLLLGSAADAGEDGLLQVHEIFNLRLAADLVVLSACDTGLGKRLRGEGILGLSRAFFYAGATAMVVSLWPVADAASGELMQSFYRHLTAGMNKAEALRAAKRELRADGRYAHPFYWAPFILVGPP